MTVFVRARASVAGAERDVLVEVRKMDALAADDGRTVVLLDDISVFASPGLALDPLSLPEADADALLAAVEREIEGSVA